MDFYKHRYILEAVEALQKEKNWTGKTHIQKTLFITKAVFAPETPFRFVLYKHGPYSFDLDQELEQMLSYEALNLIPQDPYGPSFRRGRGASFVDEGEAIGNSPKDKIEKVAKFVGKSDVTTLESLATSIWLRTEQRLQKDDEVAIELKKLKPHLSDEVIANGVRSSSELLAKA